MAHVSCGLEAGRSTKLRRWCIAAFVHATWGPTASCESCSRQTGGCQQREVMNIKRPGLQSSDSGCAGLGSCRWGPSQRNNCKAGRRACRLKLTILGLGRVWGQQTGAKILDGLNGAASANWKESLVRPVVIRT